MRQIIPFVVLLTGLSACGDLRLPEVSLFDRGAESAQDAGTGGESAALADQDGDTSAIDESGAGAPAGAAQSDASLSGGVTTVASLGDPAVPGLWLETPLVSVAQQARLRSDAGAEVTVTLKPAPDAGGGRLSIAAMRALGAPLTELVPIQILPAG